MIGGIPAAGAKVVVVFGKHAQISVAALTGLPKLMGLHVTDQVFLFQPHPTGYRRGPKRVDLVLSAAELSTARAALERPPTQGPPRA